MAMGPECAVVPAGSQQQHPLQSIQVWPDGAFGSAEQTESQEAPPPSVAEPPLPPVLAEPLAPVAPPVALGPGLSSSPQPVSPAVEEAPATTRTVKRRSIFLMNAKLGPYSRPATDDG